MSFYLLVYSIHTFISNRHKTTKIITINTIVFYLLWAHANQVIYRVSARIHFISASCQQMFNFIFYLLFLSIFCIVTNRTFGRIINFKWFEWQGVNATQIVNQSTMELYINHAERFIIHHLITYKLNDFAKILLATPDICLCVITCFKIDYFHKK